MGIFSVILLFITLLVIGFISIYVKKERLMSEYNFAHEYREKFINFANNKNLNGACFTWLQMNSDKVQNSLGYIGIIDYTAPWNRYRIPEYHIILNTILSFTNGSIDDFHITASDNALLRYLGVKKQKIEDEERKQRNPIIWFREGIKSILNLLPMSLNWFGIISENKKNKFIDNAFYNVVSGVFAITAFLSAIVTIIAGKEVCIKLIHQIFNK
jgi:hypothetical protein